MSKEHCIVCGTEAGDPIFASEGSFSLTTMLDVLPEPTVVLFCDRCGHLQTRPLPDLEHYYSQHYQVLVNSEDEDQYVSLRDGRNVLRNSYQIETLLGKIQIPHGARVLDYGCAKSATMRILQSLRADVEPHVFDVSDLYIPFWEKFIVPGRWATHIVPGEWTGQFDLVTSFFALEHVERPVEFMKQVRNLIKPGGIFYGIVPNAYGNVADFVVADHVSHFSESSLRELLEEGGFEVMDIDAEVHTGAWIFVGRRSDEVRRDRGADVVLETRKQALEMADYWKAFGDRAREFEEGVRGKSAIIYGSGFYGMYIMTCLRDPSTVVAFLDRNPHRQNQRMADRPILDPSDAPEAAEVVYVGLNPRIAREAISSVEALHDRGLKFFFP